jgi:YVTN family beta-propeller protein
MGKRRLAMCIAVVAASMLISAGAAPGVAKRKPVTIKVGSHPVGVGVDTLTHEAFVTDSVDGTVSVVDPATRKVKHVTKVGAGPERIVVDSAAGQAYLLRPNFLTVLDTTTYAVTANYAVGDNPSGVDFDGFGFVYVTNYSSNTLSVVDVNHKTVVRTLPVGNHPTDVAVDPVSRKVYVVELDGHDLWTVNGPYGTLIQRIQLGGSLTAVTVDPKTSVAYLVDRDHGRMVGLDPTTYSLTWSAPVGLWPTDIQLAPNAGHSGRLLVPDQDNASVTVMDIARHRTVNKIKVGNDPTFIATDTTTAWVTNQHDATVTNFPI